MGVGRGLLVGVGGSFAALVAVLALRTLTFGEAVPEGAPSTLEVDVDRVAGRLAEAVRFRTVSRQGGGADPAPFHALQDWVATTWPTFAAQTEVHRVGEGGLTVLRVWRGSDPSLPPVLLSAHQDVVPVEAGTEGDWTHPPFSGERAPCGAQTCIWGRGTIDMKAALVTQLEAAEALAQAGEVPRRTVIFAHTHDEEVARSGASAVADWMQAQGLQASWALDEGLVVTHGIIGGVDAPVALIGVAEKGFLSVELVATGPGGHSSMPGPSTPAGAIGRAVARLEADPFPAGLDGPAGMMFGRLGPHLPLGQRAAFANTWLLGGVVSGILESKPTTNTLVRTTQAVTILEAGTQDNIIPQRARAVVNYRLHPRDTMERALARIRRVVADPSLDIHPLATAGNTDPSPVSSADSEGYRAVERALLGAVPDAIVAPGLFIAATDSARYGDIADDVYRFHPFFMHEGDNERIHGTDERLTEDNLVAYVRFYDHIVRAAAGLN